MRNRALLILATLILACSGETESDTRRAQPPSRARRCWLPKRGVRACRNRPVRTLVTALRLITAFASTRFAAREQKLVWGPTTRSTSRTTRAPIMRLDRQRRHARLGSQALADLCDGAPDTCFEHDSISDADEHLDYAAFPPCSRP
jgi:hypothetical protein